MSGAGAACHCRNPESLVGSIATPHDLPQQTVFQVEYYSYPTLAPQHPDEGQKICFATGRCLAVNSAQHAQLDPVTLESSWYRES